MKANEGTESTWIVIKCFAALADTLGNPSTHQLSEQPYEHLTGFHTVWAGEMCKTVHLIWASCLHHLLLLVFSWIWMYRGVLWILANKFRLMLTRICFPTSPLIRYKSKSSMALLSWWGRHFIAGKDQTHISISDQVHGTHLPGSCYSQPMTVSALMLTCWLYAHFNHFIPQTCGINWQNNNWVLGREIIYLLIDLFEDSVKNSTSTQRPNFDVF